MKPLLAAVLLIATPLAFAQKPSGTLKVYFADVEGGQATLFVPPSGENLLVDAGWPGAKNADRMMELLKAAEVKKIDNLLITHYHVDHVGGVPGLAARIPVSRFIDHGVNREEDDKATVTGWQAYQKILANGHYARLTAKPGETLPIKGMRVEVVSADGNVLDKPLAGAGDANPACAASIVKAAENSENDRSVGMIAVDVPGQQAGQGGRLCRLAPRLRPQLQPGAGRCDRAAGRHHGQRSHQGRPARSLGDHRPLAPA
jgi:hypothetical protein